MGDLTLKMPKPLLMVARKPIFQYTLELMRDIVTEVLVVVGYRGDQIVNRFGHKFHDTKLSYIEQGSMRGTAGALWAARPYLQEGKFLVMNGDDLYDGSEIARCFEDDLTMGLSWKEPWSERTLVVNMGKDNVILGHHLPAINEKREGGLVVNGVYVLDQKIFEYAPVQITKGEFGLPHTIFAMARDYPVKGVLMRNWAQINYPHHLKEAEAMLRG